MWPPKRERSLGLLLAGHLCAEAVLGGADFSGRVARCKVLRLEDLADLHLGAAVEWSALEPVDCFFLRLHLPHPETGDQFLRLGERAFSHRTLVSVELHARALGTGMQSLACEHHAGLHELFVELTHLFE